ncbi:hypothetical protein ASG52_11695 [Methylobacterium sp. Leaf456]|uniref:hypothetical protein n=1 Tax=Methylobacterium sp. Leaf456 TaxID=1736382 RepID=UPI0006F68881|nr:hypothetical protein [Methylobacterium sp. Leaf456]KQT47915.1 hypothetical protein ASG52_11695 [Methylobacterium sp. Leaf456]
MRTVSAALFLTLATAPAAAQNANPSPYLPDDGPGSAFPRTGDRWLYAVRQPASRGQDKFTRVDAVPARGSGSWTVTVTCGLVSNRTGKETDVIVGKGTMGRGRMPMIGGNWVFPGSPRTGGHIDQAPSDGDRLDLMSHFSDTRCASGRGDLSSGD